MARKPYHGMRCGRSWSEWNLPDFLMINMEKHGFTQPFHAQAEVLDAFFGSSRDIAIGHPTGSGKTLGYLAAAIVHIHHRIVPRVRVAVIVPNKRLAVQVFQLGTQLLLDSGLSIGILGHVPPASDVLVATASRITDFIVEHDPALLRFVEILVIDEGDLVLDQPIESFVLHLRESLVAVGESLAGADPPRLGNRGSPGRRVRKIICSATLSRRPGQAEALGMVRPLLLAEGEGRYVAPVGVVEEFVVCKSTARLGLLVAVQRRFERVLCFVASDRRMEILARCLGGVAFSKDCAHTFPEGRCLLIATDELARGVDFPEVDVVVNFDVPRGALQYVHRMGRTGRAGRGGACVSFVLERGVEAFRDIVAKVEGAAPRQSDLEEAPHDFPWAVSELEATKKSVDRSARGAIRG